MTVIELIETRKSLHEETTCQNTEITKHYLQTKSRLSKVKSKQSLPQNKHDKLNSDHVKLGRRGINELSNNDDKALKI